MALYPWAWQQLILMEELLLCLWVVPVLFIIAWNYLYLGGNNARKAPEDG